MNLISFSSNLKKVRIKKGLSQQKFSELINISRETISKWERGIYYPNTEYIIKICEVLEIEPNDLFKN